MYAFECKFEEREDGRLRICHARSNYTKMIQLLDGEKRRKEVSKIFTDEKMFRDACHKTFLSCLSISVTILGYFKGVRDKFPYKSSPNIWLISRPF